MEEDMKIPNHVDHSGWERKMGKAQGDAQKLWTCTGGKDGGGDL